MDGEKSDFYHRKADEFRIIAQHSDPPAASEIARAGLTWLHRSASAEGEHAENPASDAWASHQTVVARRTIDIAEIARVADGLGPEHGTHNWELVKDAGGTILTKARWTEMRRRNSDGTF